MDWTPVFVVPIVFGTVAYMIKLILEHITRNKLIDKGMVDENIKNLFSMQGFSRPLNNIKIGMILVGIGVAIFAREFLYINDEAMIGLMFLFAGIAFFVYYFLVKNKSNGN